MSLPTNRMPGDIIQAVDINQIAEAVNQLSDGGTSGPGGTTDHAALTNRDAADQHPIGSVTGLQSALNGKAATGHGHTIEDVEYLQIALSNKAEGGHQHGADDLSGVVKTVNGTGPDALGNVTVAGGGDGGQHFFGTGSPEGQVTADRGATYSASSAPGMVGFSYWIKVTQGGNTGWRVLRGDTGWRNVTTIFSGVFHLNNQSDTGVFMRRLGDTVYIGVKASTVGIGEPQVSMPDGFQPTGESLVALGGIRAPQAAIQLYAQSSGAVMFLSCGQPANTRVAGTLIYPAPPVWPVALPGTAG